MKTIQVSDEDYKILMDLSKELQLQNNNGQAFPYFWEPSSKKLETNINDEGEVREFYYDGETYICDSERLENFANVYEDIWESFCEANFLYVDDEETEIIKYNVEQEEDWEEYLRDSTDCHFYSSDWKRSRDHNPSLFMSDVKRYCEQNNHHLGRDPQTYSDSIWRMPKMEALVATIYRLNPQAKDKVNHEALRFVYPKKEKI